ncbi:MFS transporter [Flammeovirga sp. MY04]|uniref:VC0807 family protein n=1 Tax=Flammeovirga sp. MY04 TaxID=1191459 RepID=UPI00082476A6|nr:VC0807 family protein [Flammeovirga sp. MY04]ANQ49125.2 MFS transporter [Flammeovirga sp. MY04]
MQMQVDQKVKKKENPLWSLVFNIVIPVLILLKLSDDEYLGDLYAMLIALAFPIGYSIYDFKVRKEVSIIAVLGIINVALTGGVKLLNLPPEYIAIKEAMVPFVIAVLIFFSTFTKYPLVNKFIYNDMIMDIKKIESKLEETNHQVAFKKLLKNTSFIVAGSFLVSMILNYVIAKAIVVSPANTKDFNDEIAYLQSISFVAIALPSMAFMVVGLWYLTKGITRLTGYQFQEILVGYDEEMEKKKAEEENNLND